MNIIYMYIQVYVNLYMYIVCIVCIYYIHWNILKVYQPPTFNHDQLTWATAQQLTFSSHDSTS